MALFRKDPQQSAEKLVAKGKIDAAIKEYKKVLESSPGDTNTLNRVGDLYVRLRKTAEAVEYYTKTAEKYARDGFLVKAIAVFKKIQRIDPSAIEMHGRLAELYQQQGLLNEARSHYSQLADHYARQDDTQKAIGVYEKLVELEPENPSHHLKLADLYREKGALSSALRSYGRIATLMLSHGQVDHAFQVYERAIEVDPSDLGFLEEASSALKDAGDEERAGKLLGLASSLNPQAREVEERVMGSVASPASLEPGDFEPEDREPGIGEPASDEPAFDLGLAAAGSLDDQVPDDLSVDVAPDLDDGPEITKEVVTDPARAKSSTHYPDDLDLGPEVVGAPLEEQVESQVFTIEPEPESEEIELEFDLLAEDEGLGSVDLSESPVEAEVSMDVDSPEPAGREPEDDFVLIEEPPPEIETPAASAPTNTDGEGVEDLLAEAKVFFKYGLAEKAIDRLEEVLQLDDENREALQQLIPALAKSGRTRELKTLLDQAQSVFERAGDSDGWASTVEQVVEAGVDLEDLEAASRDPGSPAASQPSSAPEPIASPVLEPVEESTQQVEPESLVSASESAPVDEPHRMPEIELDPPAEPEAFELDLGDDAQPFTLDLDEEGTPEVQPLSMEPEASSFDDPGGQATVSESEAVAAEPETSAPPVLEEGAQWLDSPEQEVSAAVQADSLAADEAQFFDLAAELQDELSEPEQAAETPSDPREQSLDDIVEGFKRGVAENISEEESDTHYNLGIAYREMLLIDEAIGEFQISAKDPKYRFDSCAMLGLCFREKGLSDLSIKWYQRAADSEGISEEQRLGMLYELGTTYESLNDTASAVDAYTEVHGANAAYRDVAERLTSLQAPVDS